MYWKNTPCTCKYWSRITNTKTYCSNTTGKISRGKNPVGSRQKEKGIHERERKSCYNQRLTMMLYAKKNILKILKKKMWLNHFIQTEWLSNKAIDKLSSAYKNPQSVLFSQALPEESTNKRARQARWLDRQHKEWWWALSKSLLEDLRVKRERLVYIMTIFLQNRYSITTKSRGTELYT